MFIRDARVHETLLEFWHFWRSEIVHSNLNQQDFEMREV